MMKAYTDIEQSKKLKVFLALESADMVYLYWINSETKKEGIDKIPTIRESLPIDSCDVPCWSLTALLGVLPNYKLSSEHNKHTCTVETSFGKETVAWFDNPIDACVAMIIKLQEVNSL